MSGVVLHSIQAIVVGYYLAVILWVRSNPFEWKGKEKKNNLKIHITAILTGSVIYGLCKWYNVPVKTTVFISIPAYFGILARIIRVRYSKALNQKRLLLFSIADFILGVLVNTLSITWIIAIYKKGILSVENIILFPIIYVLFCFYGILNASIFFPKRVKLAVWRLSAYAFPEKGVHKHFKVRKTVDTSLQIADILGWILFLFIVFLMGVLGFWLSHFPIVTISYFIIVFSICIWFITSGRFMQKNTNTPKIFKTIVLGTTLVVLQLTLFWIMLQVGVEVNKEAFRIFLLIPFCLPVTLWAINSVPEWPKNAWKFLKIKTEQNPSLSVVKTLSTSIHHSVFDKKSVFTLQSIVIALVFFVYYVVPKSAPLLNLIGIKTVAGKTVVQWFLEFENLVFNWSLPGSFSNRELLSFLFGNQGLVLMFLLWAIITLMSWTDLPDRLNKIPDFYKNKLVQKLMEFHMVLFFLYLCPFLFSLFILVPILGSKLLGYSVAIILGVFTFGFFFIKLESFLISLAYLMIALFNTKYNKHAIDINNASQSDLEKLPGVAAKLAKEIIKHRPFQSVNDLKSINHVGIELFTELEPLVRIGI